MTIREMKDLIYCIRICTKWMLIFNGMIRWQKTMDLPTDLAKQQARKVILEVIALLQIAIGQLEAS